MLICSSCGEECESVDVDFGIGAYDFGSQRTFHTDIHTVSSCCLEGLLEGAVAFQRFSVHTAHRDHGHIRKGQRYRKRVMKSWGTNADLIRQEFFSVQKWVLT